MTEQHQDPADPFESAMQKPDIAPKVTPKVDSVAATTQPASKEEVMSKDDQALAQEAVAESASVPSEAQFTVTATPLDSDAAEAAVAGEPEAQLRALEREIARVLVGQRQVVRQVIVALLAGGHVLVEGLPGLGKTLLLRSLAQIIGGRFARVQFTPDLMPSDITGHVMFNMQAQQFHLRRGPIFCHFLLGDEINRAPAKTQAALLEAMQEKQVTIEGQSHPLPQPFMVMATQNPLEQEGTYALPQAQLDRFLLNVLIDYPSMAEECELVRQVTSAQVGDQLDVSDLQVLFNPATIQALQQAAAAIHVDEAVLDYIVRLVRTTRSWQGLDAGAGPRAAIALLRAARAHALAEGNDFVTPDDVKQMCLPVLRHRVQLTPDLEIGGHSVDGVLLQLVDSVDAPRE
ncbi:MAG: AAA family ATPase [Xanthomonadales bacterium]|nr:AAA family ATPase [Xanthomonadales bacterium]